MARPGSLGIVGGTAELVQTLSCSWNWTGKGADGISGAAGDGACCATAEEAAAPAGAFLEEHADGAVDRP